MTKIKIKLEQPWDFDDKSYGEGAEVEIDENTYKSMKDHVKHSVIGDKPVTQPKDK